MNQESYNLEKLPSQHEKPREIMLRSGENLSNFPPSPESSGNHSNTFQSDGESAVYNAVQAAANIADPKRMEHFSDPLPDTPESTTPERVNNNGENIDNLPDYHEEWDDFPDDHLVPSVTRRDRNPCPVVNVQRRYRDPQHDGGKNYNFMFRRVPKWRRDRPRRPAHRVKSASERFYDDSYDQRESSVPHELFVSFDDEPRRAQIQQSKRLPSWAWYLLSKSLGVKSRPNEKPIFATFLHILTLTFGFTFAITYTWQKVYDIVSEYTKSTVLTGSVEVVICLCWVSLTIYANKCAARLFSSKNFVGSVRLHSKTIFKISAVGLISILAVAFMALNSYHGYHTFSDDYCLHVNLSAVVCKVVYPSRVTFNVFGITWNLMVAFVLLSVCRTHTVGIRRFIKELEIDGKKYEKFWKDRMQRTTSQPRVDIDSMPADNDLDTEWYIWDDQFSPSEVLEDWEGGSGPKIPRTVSDPTDQSTPSVNASSLDQDNSRSSTRRPHGQGDAADQTDTPGMETGDADDAPIMTNEDILLCYWKISCRMRVTSLCLQRWLSSWIAFVVLWCANYVIYWTSHDATVIGIAEFLIPLLMIPLLSSAYAEANTEGQRMIRSICPIEERLPLLYYLGQQPLQMTVFNFPVTYNAIITVIAAFAVALASRIVLDEVLT